MTPSCARQTTGLTRAITTMCGVLAFAAWASALTASSIVAQPPGRGTVRTDTLWAQSLGVNKSVTVYLPPSYATSPTRRYPVLVYLHGLHGNERNWIEQGVLGATLDSMTAAGKPEAIVVMPDGDDGWYTTWNQLPDVTACRADTIRKEPASAYCVPWPHYDDYVARDVVNWVDQRYRTIADNGHRGIAGLSMGGLGAVTLALVYPDVFGAAASHSGVLSPRYLGPAPFANPPQYANTVRELETAARGLWSWMWPAFGRDTIGWMARDPGVLAERAVRSASTIALPKLWIDCGVDDAFINQNRDFHQTLLRLGVSHQYAENPGAHAWSYWRSHASRSIEFLLSVVGQP